MPICLLTNCTFGKYDIFQMANETKVPPEQREFKPTQVEVNIERWRRAKAAAAIEGKPLYRVVDEALAKYLGEAVSQ